MPQTDPGHDLTFTQERELSYLAFDRRVLDQAASPRLLPLDRLRFFSIFHRNLDDFFRVRVGALLDRAVDRPGEVDSKGGQTPAQRLEGVLDGLRPLLALRDAVWASLRPALAGAGAHLLPPEALDGPGLTLANRWWREGLCPHLCAQTIPAGGALPALRGGAVYAAAVLSAPHGARLGLVELGEGLPPVLPLGEGAFLLAQELILARLDDLFPGHVLAHRGLIRLTRSAHLPEEASLDCDPRQGTRRLLARRELGAPVRLELQGDGEPLWALLGGALPLSSRQLFPTRCPLSWRWIRGIPRSPALSAPPHRPVWPAALDRDRPLWPQVMAGDVLLCHPTHAMAPFLALLRQCGDDPAVTAISITVYRLAPRSQVVHLLCRAARLGKAVTVVLELRARFDEEANLRWAEMLEGAGCRVLFGPPGLKCHAKLCLIQRTGPDGPEALIQIGTGNYHEGTARQYTDYSLLTAHPEIAADAQALFRTLAAGQAPRNLKRLIAAPHDLRPALLALIDGEIAKGERGRIVLKTNGLSDRPILDRLALAARSGVRVDLLVRGICCLRPGVTGRTQGLTVTSIVGRFLEHSRIFAFGTGASRQVFLSSADLMTRNQARRVEVVCPILDPHLGAALWAHLQRLLEDTRNASRLAPDGAWRPVPPGDAPMDGQQP